MNSRLTTLKTVLWGLVGVAFVLTVARFARGLGATTHLNDSSPWGLWIAFDVMAGVALAAGGFVLAATVYIFGLERYRQFARPAILTALLGYTAVAVGLLYDLGLPWNIWHPIVSPQPHSVLFEVAMCVMIYLTVLFLEFGPVILEHPLFDRPWLQAIHRGLKKITIPLVIAGIVLSSLHQSSLGSLFLIVPHRLHELWYSPIIWILFLISAVGLGLMMVVGESLFSAFFLGHRPNPKRLAGLGHAAAWVLLLYAGLRLGDLAVRGELPAAFSGTWQANLFLFELGFSALVPAALMLIRPIRERTLGVGLAAAMVILGVIGYRFDVCLVAFYRPESAAYFPSWMEIFVSLGIVAGFMLVFLFFVQHLRVYPEDHGDGETGQGAPRGSAPKPSYQPASGRFMAPGLFGLSRRVTLAAVFGAAIAAALLPSHVWSGDDTLHTPTASARHLPAFIGPEGGLRGQRQISIDDGQATPPADAQPGTVLLIDGNRDGRAVVFWHDGHAQRLGGAAACGTCHHLNMPLDRNTACHRCHRDMYTRSDIFDHALHVEKMGDNQGCIRCHRDPQQPKRREQTTPCGACHQQMVVADSRVKLPAEGLTGLAPGYMQSMHGLCVKCHHDVMKDAPEKSRPDLDQCVVCHSEPDPAVFQQMSPRRIPDNG